MTTVLCSLRSAVTCGLLVCFSATYTPESRAATATFLYDELGRLTQVSQDNGIVLKYTYDKAGNRTQELVDGSTVMSPEQKAVAAIIFQLLLEH